MSWWLLDIKESLFKLKAPVMIILSLLPDNIHFFENTIVLHYCKICAVTIMFKLLRFLKSYNFRLNLNSNFT